MIKDLKSSSFMPYLKFSRKKWAALRNSVPRMLNEAEIIKLKKIDESLCVQEIADIYFPLSHLINLYVNFDIHHKVVLKKFFGIEFRRIPFIIGITGSVAVGKSITARLLQMLLSQSSKSRSVDLVTTDGFLYPNYILKQRNLMKKKGFPESYDIHSLINFILKVKSGAPRVTAPIYSHLIYDVIPNKKRIIFQPEIIILEGLNILQITSNYNCDLGYTSVSDFIDFSIYIDAPETLLRGWYINRFLKFRQIAFSNPNSYFYHYSQLSEQEAIANANRIWNNINRRNLHENILPIRERANLILFKRDNHTMKKILLRQ